MPDYRFEGCDGHHEKVDLKLKRGHCGLACRRITPPRELSFTGLLQLLGARPRYLQ
jgi:hypothetical protein